MTTRDESAQEIADRMAPIMAREGFAAEWELCGPAIVEARIETAVKDAEKRLDAAFAELSREQGKTDGWVTVHCSLATGRSMTTEALEQREHRLILDGSCEHDQLTTYRNFCRLLGGIKQTMLASAGEVTIATAPLDQSSWILSNTAHPDGRCAGLRIVILLPLGDPGGGDHCADLHKVAHLAVVKARLAAGKSTLVWLSGLHYSEILDLAKEIESPRGALQVVQTGPGKLLAAIHPDEITGVFRGSCHVVFSPAWQPGEAPPIYSHPFHNSIAETLTLLLGVSSSVSIKESFGPVEVSPGFDATIFAKGKAAEYWRAVMDTWRRGGIAPYYLPATLDDYAKLAKGEKPYRTVDWLHYSRTREEEAEASARPQGEASAFEAGGGYVR